MQNDETNVKYPDEMSVEILQSLDLEGIETLMTALNTLKEEKLSNNLTLCTYVNEYMKFKRDEGISEAHISSIQTSLNHLMSHLGKYRLLTDINQRQAQHVKFLLTEHAPDGYPLYLSNIKTALKKAVEWEYIKVNPFEKIKAGKKQQINPAFIVKDELNLILDNINNSTLRDLTYFAFYTGCRLGEIVNLRWKNVNFKNREVIIGGKEFTTKSKRQRTVPLTDSLHDLLWKRSQEGNESGDDQTYVFGKDKHFPYTTQYVSKKFKASCRKAGISEEIHFHSLRHSFASNIAMKNGGDILVLKELLGHSSITTTQIYCHLNKDKARKTVALLEAA